MKAIIKRLLSPMLQKVSAAYLRKRRKFTYGGLSVWVEPGVFPPFLTISTKLLLQFVETLDLKSKKFLELGCGCGIISLLAAQNGARVTATDLNPVALRALGMACEDNKVEVEILESDLFENLTGRHFDCIVINPPYYPKTPQTVAEQAWFCGADFEYFRRLFAQLPAYVLPGNATYMILSDDCEVSKIIAMARENGLAFELVQEKKVITETDYIFLIARGHALP